VKSKRVQEFKSSRENRKREREGNNTRPCEVKRTSLPREAYTHTHTHTHTYTHTHTHTHTHNTRLKCQIPEIRRCRDNSLTNRRENAYVLLCSAQRKRSPTQASVLTPKRV
jgi:hypothetical protein